MPGWFRALTLRLLIDMRHSRILWAVLAAGTLVTLIALAVVGRWPLAADGHVVITDFATVWAAGVRALAGEPGLAYHHAVHEAFYAGLIEQPPADGLTFGYPPTAFMLFAPFALLPYGTAMLAYLLIGIMLWFAALRGIARDGFSSLAMALAWGGATQTIMLGQNGFLTAAAMVGGLLCLRKNPILAGVLFGLLTIKPHLGLALALFLLMRREWTAIAAAIVTTAVLMIASIALWGLDIWLRYFEASRGVIAILADRTDSVIGDMMQSGFALAAPFVPWHVALALHAVLAIAALGAMALVVLRRGDFGIQSAAVIAATLLVTPYSFLYDSTMLTAALAFLLAMPLVRGERWLLGVAAVLPGLWFFTAQPFVPVAAAIILLVCVLRTGPPHAGEGNGGSEAKGFASAT